MIGSVNATLPEWNIVDYSATKAALANYAKSLSKEFGPKGIRVNTVSPGPVATDLWLADDGIAAQFAAASGASSGRGGAVRESQARPPAASPPPQEVADLTVFLASDRSANITGSDIRIDGGYVTTTLRHPRVPKGTDTEHQAQTPVIFIHGLWIHSSAWQPWLDLFADPRLPVSAPGLARRCGRPSPRLATTPTPSTTSGSPQIVDHYAESDRRRPRCKPIVIGHSFGGLIAQELLAGGARRRRRGDRPRPDQGREGAAAWRSCGRRSRCWATRRTCTARSR